MENINDTVKADKWMEEYAINMKKKDEQIKDMSSNVDYINWLDNFTKDKESFCDDEWLYFPDSIPTSDKENVDKLGFLYEIVNKYACDNNIYPFPCEFGDYYQVRLNDFGFELGILVGQGTVFFCRRVLVEDTFIDFNNIINTRNQKSNNDLETISNSIEMAYENGHGVEEIKDTCDKTIKKLPKRIKRKYIK